MKNKNMQKLNLLAISMVCMTLPTFSPAQTPTTTQIQIAQANHEQNCPKDLPSALFDAKKLRHYQSKWHLEKGLMISAGQSPQSEASALPWLIESAVTPQNVTFKMTQSGCEFVNEELVIDLPISSIEKNGKFCNECLIQNLKGLKPYFLEDRGGLFMNSVDTLNHAIKNQKIRVKYEYIDPEGGEMAHSIIINHMEKIPAQNIWRIQLTASIGPL